MGAGPIPSILLEGDPEEAPVASGPGDRYVLAPEVVLPSLGEQRGETELPESYGTGRLFLRARDPHWLHLAWDLTTEQQQEYVGRSADGSLRVRVYVRSVNETPCEEARVPSDARSWFLQVEHGGERYIAELGYRAGESEWKRIALSEEAWTPPDGVSEDASVEFATVPPEEEPDEVRAVLAAAVAEDISQAEVLQQLRSEGLVVMLPVSTLPTRRLWTLEQARALAAAVHWGAAGNGGLSSGEFGEGIGQDRGEVVSAPEVVGPIAVEQPEHEIGPAGGVCSMAEGFGRVENEKPFWFNINAELVIYGATEPDAQVGIGGRRIKLRPDGTFSLRFSLPDGEYDLKVLAVSADGASARLAELRFGRGTTYTGEVGMPPQDPALKTPPPAHGS